MIELEETEKRTQAQENRARIRAEAEAVKSREHDISVERMRKDVQDSVNKTQLEAERIRSGAMREGKEAANETNKLTRLQAAAQLQAKVDKSIEMEKSKPTYDALLRRANMPETPESLPMITNAKAELAKREADFDRMRKEAKDTVDYIKVQTGMIPPTQAAPTAGNRPQVKGAAARGAPPRAPIDSFYTR
jgi:hypothetical protein